MIRAVIDIISECCKTEGHFCAALGKPNHWKGSHCRFWRPQFQGTSDQLFGRWDTEDNLRRLTGALGSGVHEEGDGLWLCNVAGGQK